MKVGLSKSDEELRQPSQLPRYAHDAKASVDCRFFFCGVLKGCTELLAVELLHRETGGDFSITPPPVIHRHSNLKVNNMCAEKVLPAFHKSKGALSAEAFSFIFNLLSSRAFLR